MQLLKEGGKVPKLAKDTLALKVPNPLLNWLDADNKNYKQRVHMDANGFLMYPYNVMVAEKVWPAIKGDDGKWHQGEHVSYLVCTHLTLHLLCIERSYWDYTIIIKVLELE